ncbi:MAG: YjbH domain-containing protein [Bacteroidales bacterium]
MHRKIRDILFALILLFFNHSLCAQTVFGNQGLLTIPTADMNAGGSFMGGGNYLPAGIIDVPKWNYDSWNYYVSATFLPFWDVGFRFTGLRVKSGKFNQDRSVYTKIRPLNEGRWYPSLAIGCEDLKIARFNGNNYHMKLYAVATKSIRLSGHELACSLGYTYRETEDQSHFLQAGISYKPAFAPDMQVMVEYDGRHANAGIRYMLFRHLVLTAGTFRFHTFTGGAALIFRIR